MSPAAVHSAVEDRALAAFACAIGAEATPPAGVVAGATRPASPELPRPARPQADW
ncbi:hypothetical protein [Amycolatopsis sp. NPDC051903]|uniref:hypothetical protein n=1 Tax=Amycolatopsis sp. NPDC051903 TaxID=3363936 RepID=UPI0037B0F489